MTFITSSFVHKNDVHSSDEFATMFTAIKYCNISQYFIAVNIYIYRYITNLVSW